MANQSWYPSGAEIVDINGSAISTSLDHQLADAVQGKAPFPKELIYSDAMELWAAIAATSYQSTDELDILKAKAAEIVANLPSGSVVIDMGCGDSSKYMPLIEAFLAAGKMVTYVPLDLNSTSLLEQVRRAKAQFPTIQCVGLWGNFDDGDRFYHKITGPKLFLSLGSIFLNAPDEMCNDRLTTFKSHLGPHDMLLIGQDGPTEKDRAKAHAAYGTNEYKRFITQYLRSVSARAGIRQVPLSDPRKAWSVESKSVNSKHYFDMTARIDMICSNFGDIAIPKGTVFEIFPSWKRTEDECVEYTQRNGLTIRTVGKAPNSGFRQFLITNPASANSRI